MVMRRAMLGMVLAGPALAQGRRLRLVVPYGAGSGPDLFARSFAALLAARLEEAVVVDNRPGASTLIGAEHVQAAAPDGRTLLLGTSTTFCTNPVLFRRLPYDPARFTAITPVLRTRLALYASPSVPARDVAGALALARAAREPLHYGMTGRGNCTHLTGEALKSAAGIELQDVLYRGTGILQQGIVRGDIPLAIDGIPAWLPLAADGRVRVLAVTGEGRVGALPDVPSFAEAGLADMGRNHWYGLFAPQGLAAPVLARLHAAAVAVMADAPAWARLVHEGGEIETRAPPAFAAMVAEERDAWGAVIRRIGLVLD